MGIDNQNGTVRIRDCEVAAIERHPILLELFNILWVVVVSRSENVVSSTYSAQSNHYTVGIDSHKSDELCSGEAWSWLTFGAVTFCSGVSP